MSIIPLAAVQPSPAPPPARPRRRLRTVGVEEELLLVDAATLAPRPCAADVILAAAAVPGMGARRAPIILERELKREQIEVVSPPVRTRSELEAVLGSGRDAADRAARAIGARAVPVATAPQACCTHTSPDPRYDRMRERFAVTLDEQLTCGFHVHVGIDSADEGVGVLDRIRPWLPVLLALSANSPYWQGVDTAFASYRYQAWGRWPTAGPTDVFGSAGEYRRQVGDMLATGVCLDEGMIYFDARLSAHVPTVEVRIADVCLHAQDAVTIAVVVRALVERAAHEWRAGMPPPPVSTAALRLAGWRASRWGLADELIHPVTQRLVPAKDAVRALLSHTDRHFGSEPERMHARSGVAAILRRGNGADEQRAAVLANAGDPASAVLAALAG